MTVGGQRAYRRSWSAVLAAFVAAALPAAAATPGCTPSATGTALTVRPQPSAPSGSEAGLERIRTTLAKYGRLLGIEGEPTCFEVVHGSGVLGSNDYPCHSSDRALCVRGLVASPGGRVSLRLVDYDVVQSAGSKPVLMAFPSYPPGDDSLSQGFDFAGQLNRTIILGDTATLLLYFGGSGGSLRFAIDFKTELHPVTGGDAECVPLRNSTFQLNPPSHETRNKIDMIRAMVQNITGIPRNLICVEELHGRGTLMSPNYPCHYPDNELCGWILRADPGSGGDRSISLRVVDFDVEPTYDPLLVFSSFPPSPDNLLAKLDGTLEQNYTIVIDNSVASVAFTSSKATTRRGFMIEFTTIDRESKEEHPNVLVIALVAAAVALTAAVSLILCLKRRRDQRMRAKSEETKRAYDFTAAVELWPAADESCSFKNGLTFGGRRPTVLLLSSREDRRHGDAVMTFAKILQTFGGCDVLWKPKAETSMRDWLRGSIATADKILFFLSRGADLVERAFLDGKMYPKQYRESDLYFSVPQAVDACKANPAVRQKALVVRYDFYGTDSCSSAIVSQLGGAMPVFRLLADMPSLISFIHGEAPDSLVHWSCQRQCEESNELNDLRAAVEALEQLSAKADWLETEYGTAVDCHEYLVNNSAALRLSAVSDLLSYDRCTDAITLTSASSHYTALTVTASSCGMLTASTDSSRSGFEASAASSEDLAENNEERRGPPLLFDQ